MAEVKVLCAEKNKVVLEVENTEYTFRKIGAEVVNTATTFHDGKVGYNSHLLSQARRKARAILGKQNLKKYQRPLPLPGFELAE